MAKFDLPVRYDIAAMQRIETALRPPWIIIASSQQGRRHYDDGENCQDNHIVGGVRDVTWMIIADGVSSSIRSEQGSAEACHAVHHYLGRVLSSGAKPSKQLIAQAIHVARSKVADLARSERRHIDDFGTTLAVALIHGNTIITGAIGDSSVAISSLATDYDNSETRHFTPFCTPQQSGGEGVIDLTADEWHHALALAQTDNPAIDLLFLATDGGHNFFLNPKGRSQHAFDPAYPLFLIKTIKAPKTGPLLIGNVLAKFMQDIPSEGHDDRTILIAARIPDNVIPTAQEPQRL